MRYSLLDGGKRLRPILAIRTCEAFGGAEAEAMPAACALEMIHTYSLIHDDLPAMDDDDFRRGKPSCHKAFDEATAILAGDALQAAAFEVLARRGSDPRLVLELAAAAGAAGMCGGQQLDLATGADVREIHRRKTGALLTAAVRMGAIAAGAPDRALARVTRYGRAVGLAFQIVDDILDVSGSARDLGKTPGKDARQGKKTFPALYGMEGSRLRAEACVREAVTAVAFLGERGARLRELARWILSRSG
ncbi:MAG: polyprenyl synthetase family protein [Planctomycetes bacterium]|nr:polyprenyl synthetase family protein [Planctomycetota bacterium]